MLVLVANEQPLKAPGANWVRYYAGSLSLDTHKPTHSKVKFRVPFSAKRGEIEGGAERLELVRA
jgi:hypothetical protein